MGVVRKLTEMAEPLCAYLLLQKIMGEKAMQEQRMEELNSFLQAYEDATNSHDFDQIEPLLTEDAKYFFSEGTFQGLAELRAIFQKNWDTVQEEVYRLRQVEWLAVSDEVAVCTYTYHWHGFFQGEHKEGSGRGTNVLVKRKGQWLMHHEHLSPL